MADRRTRVGELGSARALRILTYELRELIVAPVLHGARWEGS
jgi:hypothetical protein